MRMKTKLFSAVMGTALLALAGCQSAQDKAAADTLVATFTSTAPNMAAGASDPVWAKAAPLSAALTGGVNFGAKPGDKGESKVTLKAAYTADMLYMLIQYTDPTNSVRRGPYQKQADGSWKKLKDPADKGGDDNVYYEDKWAMIWNIDNSIANFDKKGCAVACHIGEGKPYGNKYLGSEGQLGDIWHFKGQRTGPLDKLDDQYLDHTRYNPTASPNAGRKNEPGGPEYRNMDLVNGKPQFMNRDARPASAGGLHYVVDGTQVPFDDSKFKAGDEVASILIFQLKGDRGDVAVVNRWANGMHTSEVSRKLVTGSKFDVQFKDLNASYGFGFAAFDNAQVQHATGDDTLYLRFAK